jgi:hypothetical protein
LSEGRFFAPRIFSLDEALECLPRLREILGGLRDARTRVHAAERELVERYHGGRGNGHTAPGGELDRLHAAMAEAQNAIDEAAREITEIGCELKDPDRGMVDFRTEREGRIVYLCWLMHEPTIAFWHELEGGYAGRQPL